MSEQKQSKLPWILLAIAIGGGAAAGLLAASQAEEAREAKRERKEAVDSAETLLAALAERNERLPLLVDSINAYWQRRFDSLSVAPPEVPPTDPRLQALLDTAQMSRELRAAIDAQSRELRQVRAQNVELRQQVVGLRVAAREAVDSVTAFWDAQRSQDAAVIAQLRIALDKAIEEAGHWETAYYASRMSWTDRILWGAGGALVGYVGATVTGGTEVNVNSCSDYC